MSVLSLLTCFYTDIGRPAHDGPIHNRSEQQGQAHNARHNHNSLQRTYGIAKDDQY